MKKNYISPVIKEVKIRMEQHVCAGTNVGVGGNSSDVFGDGDETDAKGDDFDTWGW